MAILIVSRLTIKTSGYSCFIVVVKLFEQFSIKCHYSEGSGKGDSVSVIVDTERDFYKCDYIRYCLLLLREMVLLSSLLLQMIFL